MMVSAYKGLLRAIVEKVPVPYISDASQGVKAALDCAEITISPRHGIT